jgi:hypothetical protein
LPPIPPAVDLPTRANPCNLPARYSIQIPFDLNCKVFPLWAGKSMSDDKTNPQESKEFQILKALKLVLTDVVKDTATQPGLKHPLSDRTIEGIRQCLKLISARERELVEDAGKTMDMRPFYADEPKKNVVVPIGKIGRNKITDDDKK